MSEATTRAAIKTILDSVTDVGKTYNRTRWAVTFDAILNFFKTGIGGKEQIRGWDMELTSFEQAPRTLQGHTRTYIYIIRGRLATNDAEATELTMAALAESVVNALDQSSTFGYSVARTFPKQSAPAQLTTFEYRMFGDTLCHYVEITQAAVEMVSAV